MPNRKLRLALAALSFLLAAAALTVMYSRMRAEELWGYWPLPLYLGIYAGVWLLASKTEARWKNNLRSSATGLLLGLSFPGYLPFPFPLLVAWVPLLLLHRRSDGRRIFWHAFSAFYLYNAIATFWVTNTAFGAGVFAVVVNSLLMTLPWLLFDFSRRQLPRFGYLSLVAYWLCFEYLHYNWPLNWPWLTLGNGFAQFPSLVQWYELTGVLGGTAWILTANYVAFRWYVGGRKTRTAALFLAVVLVPMGVSLLRYHTYAEPAGAEVAVSSLQPNFEPHFEKFSGDRRSQLDVFRGLATAAVAAADGPVDFMLLPETSFDYVDESTPLTNPSLRALADAVPADRLRYLITGIDAYYVFAPGEEVSAAVRYFPARDGSTTALEALNAALQVEIATDAYQTYRKGVFVPGAESFPFSDYLFFLEPLVNSLGGTVAGRGTQERRTPFVGEAGRVAPVICYESVFGEYFTDYVREGAQAAFVLTNDGWWDDTPGHLQHLWFASLRAIETRRAVVRSANVGACAFIDQRGRVVERTFYDERGYLNGRIRLNDAVTPYVRFGDLPARLGLLLGAMCLLVSVVRGWLPK